MNEREQETLEAVRELGVAPWRDLESRGLHHEYLRSLVEKGLVTRLARGEDAEHDEGDGGQERGLQHGEESRARHHDHRDNGARP